MLLLGQSAQGTYVLRGLRVSEWLQVVNALSASPNAVRIALDRSGRIADRLKKKGAVAPSPPQAKPTGTDGVIAAWVAVCAARMAADGTLHGNVEDGGLGVPRASFRRSGYLIDVGGLMPTEYQALAAYLRLSLHKTWGAI